MDICLLLLLPRLPSFCCHRTQVFAGRSSGCVKSSLCSFTTTTTAIFITVISVQYILHHLFLLLVHCRVKTDSKNCGCTSKRAATWAKS